MSVSRILTVSILKQSQTQPKKPVQGSSWSFRNSKPVMGEGAGQFLPCKTNTPWTPGHLDTSPRGYPSHLVHQRRGASARPILVARPSDATHPIPVASMRRCVPFVDSPLRCGARLDVSVWMIGRCSGPMHLHEKSHVLSSTHNLDKQRKRRYLQRGKLGYCTPKTLEDLHFMIAEPCQKTTETQLLQAPLHRGEARPHLYTKGGFEPRSHDRSVTIPITRYGRSL